MSTVLYLRFKWSSLRDSRSLSKNKNTLGWKIEKVLKLEFFCLKINLSPYNKGVSPSIFGVRIESEPWRLDCEKERNVKYNRKNIQREIILHY